MAKQPKAKKKTMQQAAPFASYMGLHLEDQREDDEKAKRAEKEEEWAKKAETDPDREQMEDESDDDYAARMEEMDEEEEKAEGEINDTDPDAEEDEEDDEKPNAKAARASERKRCARIIAYGVKANNVHQAAVFAFDTNLSASQAISAMNAANMTTPNGGLNNRMQGVKNYHVGSNAGGNDQKGQTKSTAQANGILSALEAVRGK
ncbi:RPC7 family DNA-directed RNA polymerase III subunit [Acinetobacter venetianus]|uniref:Uncharacterized protein n=1 Tax=Acinetobacter venetianus TaxID=52133 RepID=A0A150HQH5_9GAMM|nr:RPC7 family DNA-directed RNA polymerase III subunit [Acinetobacter venetianus]KXZ68775.1 hypothetical protein AVENLUH13518_02935 [Acinetobacter venetianus]